MLRGKWRKLAKKNRGFSLLELMIVVVLAAGFVMIAGVSINAVMGMDVKSEAVKIAGLTSQVYAHAAITGTTHRIVFDLNENSYWVEMKKGEVGDVSPALGYEEMFSKLQKRGKDDQDVQAALALVPQYERAEGKLGEKISLSGGITLYGAWAEQMESVARDGQVSIHFFPGGNTQTSFISVAEQDDEDSAIYVSLNPLTGAARIEFGEPNTSDLMANDSGGT